MPMQVHDCAPGHACRPNTPWQILSNNTRRTKVVELSSGTHRWAVASAIQSIVLS